MMDRQKPAPFSAASALTSRFFLGLFLSALVLPGVPGRPALAQEDFLRGDVNSDGVVSLADVHFIDNFLFRLRRAPPCLNAGDANDDGSLNATDAIFLTLFTAGAGDSPPEPFPDPGPDPTLNDGGNFDLDCAAYGNGEVLDDPAADLVVLEAVAVGGDEGKVRITLGASSSTALAGYRGVVTVDGSLFTEGESGSISICNPFSCETRNMEDLTGTFDRGVGLYRVIDGELRFVFLSTTFFADSAIPASDAVVPVLEMEVCLDRGTTAGDYGLALDRVELVDYESASAIFVPDSAATLSVSSDLAEGSGCVFVPPEPPPPPPPELDAEFELEGFPAAPGGEVTVPFRMSASGDIQAYSFSVDFDEEVLEALTIQRIHVRQDGRPFGFESFHIDNGTDEPGSGGVDEGFLIGAVVFSFQTPEFNLPADEEHHVLSFTFRVLDEVPSGTITEVTFQDGGQGPGQPVENVLTSFGKAWTPDTANSFLLVRGEINIVDEISIFIRGDSNADQIVDISDPLRTLSYLFVGGMNPGCFDAADATDDGILDITDPIRTLQFLFLDGLPLPPPTAEEPGPDPTPDSLGCLLRVL